MDQEFGVRLFRLPVYVASDGDSYFAELFFFEDENDLDRSGGSGSLPPPAPAAVASPPPFPLLPLAAVPPPRPPETPPLPPPLPPPVSARLDPVFEGAEGDLRGASAAAAAAAAAALRRGLETTRDAGDDFGLLAGPGPGPAGLLAEDGADPFALAVTFAPAPWLPPTPRLGAFLPPPPEAVEVMPSPLAAPN